MTKVGDYKEKWKQTIDAKSTDYLTRSLILDTPIASWQRNRWNDKYRRLYHCTHIKFIPFFLIHSMFCTRSTCLYWSFDIWGQWSVCLTLFDPRLFCQRKCAPEHKQNHSHHVEIFLWNQSLFRKKLILETNVQLHFSTWVIWSWTCDYIHKRIQYYL